MNNSGDSVHKPTSFLLLLCYMEELSLKGTEKQRERDRDRERVREREKEIGREGIKCLHDATLQIVVG